MVRVCGVLGCLAAFLANNPAKGTDLNRPAKVPAGLFDWSGWYAGGHVGYLAGQSGWSAASPSGLVSGTTNLTNGFDLFKGSGSFFGGLQGGYNVVLPSHLLLGVEADASFPNLVSGTSTAGFASYGDIELYSGTVRGRLGYVLSNDWLVYGTAGFAWSYDQLKTTQLADGAFPAGTDEGAYLWRIGWAAGAGIEIPVAPAWSARAEYLYTGFGDNRRNFAAMPETFISNLASQQVRFGLNYKLNDDDA
ncbi:MAG TPA: outer membrane beta-barrel protein, partial [Bradyrhizobium sp.]|nr:outer membrane beta-barrel protein [Bradyrhizobium sp.]